MRRPADQISKTHPRGSPPLKPGTPGQRSSLGLKVTAEIKNRLDAAARANGRSQSQEAELRIEWSFDFQQRLGGPRAQHLLLHLAELAQSKYRDENDWLDDYDAYLDVMSIWREALANRAPLLKIDVADQVAAGYRLAADLATTRFPRRAAHLREMLEVMSRCPTFPQSARQDFARAAAAAAPWPPIEPAPPPQAPPAPVHPFWTSWSIARVKAGLESTGGAESDADLQAIAEQFEQNADLAFLAGMPTRPTVNGVLANRALLLEHGLGPPSGRTDEASQAVGAAIAPTESTGEAIPSPPPRPARRRRAAPTRKA